MIAPDTRISPIDELDTALLLLDPDLAPLFDEVERILCEAPARARGTRSAAIPDPGPHPGHTRIPIAPKSSRSGRRPAPRGPRQRGPPAPHPRGYTGDLEGR